jgi:hypothetical protein
MVAAAAIALAAPAAAQNANTDWNGNWGFDSPSERSIDLRAAELIEAKQGGLFERQDTNITSNTQNIFCNANASSGGTSNNGEGSGTAGTNLQGTGNSSSAGCAIDGGTFNPNVSTNDMSGQTSGGTQSQFQDFTQ